MDDQWRVIDRKVRNQMRKAEKEGLRAAIGGVELLDAFYGVLVRNMRDLGFAGAFAASSSRTS